MSDDRPHLSLYTVESVERKTGRMIYSNVIATSIEDALRFERRYFGDPFFIVRRAYPKLSDNYLPQPGWGKRNKNDNERNRAR